MDGSPAQFLLHRTLCVQLTAFPNGKQESFWGQIEGRLMSMLEGEGDLTLKLLNEATLAWVEMEYHRKHHAEILQAPLQRFQDGPDVSRRSPSPADLRLAFTLEDTRTLRRSDCTISLRGRRYEIPSAFRHLKQVSLRYASWDLSHVYLANKKSGEVIRRIFPRDLEKNADRRRRTMEPGNQMLPQPIGLPGMAPLLAQHLADYRATGFPPAYLPKKEKDEQ